MIAKKQDITLKHLMTITFVILFFATQITIQAETHEFVKISQTLDENPESRTKYLYRTEITRDGAHHYQEGDTTVFMMRLYDPLDFKLDETPRRISDIDDTYLNAFVSKDYYKASPASPHKMTESQNQQKEIVPDTVIIERFVDLIFEEHEDKLFEISQIEDDKEKVKELFIQINRIMVWNIVEILNRHQSSEFNIETNDAKRLHDYVIFIVDQLAPSFDTFQNSHFSNKKINLEMLNKEIRLTLYSTDIENIIEFAIYAQNSGLRKKMQKILQNTQKE